MKDDLQKTPPVKIITKEDIIENVIDQEQKEEPIADANIDVADSTDVKLDNEPNEILDEEIFLELEQDSPCL